MKATRRTIDPITFDERICIEFGPRIEDNVLDDQLAGTMSYSVPRNMPSLSPPAPPPADEFRPPTPPKARGKSDPNQPRNPNNPVVKRRMSGGSISKSPLTSPRRSSRPTLGQHFALGNIGEHEELSQSSLSNLSALQTSIALSELKHEAKTMETQTEEVKCVRFEDEVELNEISRLRNSVIAEIFWASDEIANFRYEAFMEEAGLDISEFD